MQQIPLDIGVPLVPSFENFLPGPNGEVISYLRQWVQGGAVGMDSPPVGVYVGGESGSGKSHLVAAVANALHHRGQRVGVLRPDALAPVEFDPSWSAIILEDVHAYDALHQQLAFNWFVNAQAHQRTVFSTGNALPRALVVREDLRTRLGGGQIFYLQPLSDAQVRTVLRASAQARGLVLGDEVLDFVLHRFSRDLGSLMPLLAALDHYALQTQRAITIPFIKTMLENI